MSVNAKSLLAEDYGEAEFYLTGHHDDVVRMGRHWRVFMTVSGVARRTPGKAIWEGVEALPAERRMDGPRRI